MKANVDSTRDRGPPHSHFVGAPMPYFLEFSPGYGLHQGYLRGDPASHGCIRMPYWKARQFYSAAHIGDLKSTLSSNALASACEISKPASN